MESHSRKRRADSPPTDPPAPTDPPPTVLPTSETLAIIIAKLSELEAENIRDHKCESVAPPDSKQLTLSPKMKILQVSENKEAKPEEPVAGMDREEKIREFTVKGKKNRVETGVYKLPASESYALIQNVSSKLETENVRDKKRKREESPDAEDSTVGPQLKKSKVFEEKEMKISSSAVTDRPEDVREHSVRIMKQSATPATTEPQPQLHSASSRSASPDQSGPPVPPNTQTSDHLNLNCYVIKSASETYVVAHRIDEDVQRNKYHYQFLERDHADRSVFYIPSTAQSKWYEGPHYSRRIYPSACGTSTLLGIFVKLSAKTLREFRLK